MKAELIKIFPIENNKIFNILVVIGAEKHQFTLEIKKNRIANQEINITQGDENFEQTFLYNPKVATEIAKVVSIFSTGEDIRFPVVIDDFQPEFSSLA